MFVKQIDDLNEIKVNVNPKYKLRFILIAVNIALTIYIRQ